MPCRSTSATQPVEVLAAEPLERRQLVGEPARARSQAVRERRDDEPAVAPARAEAGRLGLEHDDVARRVVGLGVQRRPQPREPAADDAQVGVDAAASAPAAAPAAPRSSSQNARGAASGERRALGRRRRRCRPRVTSSRLTVRRAGRSPRCPTTTITARSASGGSRRPYRAPSTPADRSRRPRRRPTAPHATSATRTNTTPGDEVHQARRGRSSAR